MENKKVLFISTKVYPVRGGDTIYSAGLVFRLAEKNDLTLVTLGEKNELNNTKIFQKVSKIHSFSTFKGRFYALIKLIFNRSLLQDHSFSMKRFLRRINLNAYDIIIVDHLRAFSICSPIFKKELINTKIIYVAHNVEAINQKEKLELLPEKKFKSSLSNNVFDIENTMLNKCNSIWALNQKDLTVLSKDHHVNNTVIKPYYPWKRVKSNKNINICYNELLILGSLNWYPNIQGVLHFVNDIFPKIIEINDQIKLNIVGQNPSKEILALCDSRIRVFPNVESVDPFIKKSDLLIIPNRSGTGSKIKLLESISKGLPIITYPDNITGYENLKITKPFLVNNSYEFSDAVIKVLRNPDLRIQFIEENTQLLEINKFI